MPSHSFPIVLSIMLLLFLQLQRAPGEPIPLPLCPVVALCFSGPSTALNHPLSETQHPVTHTGASDSFWEHIQRGGRGLAHQSVHFTGRDGQRSAGWAVASPPATHFGSRRQPPSPAPPRQPRGGPPRPPITPPCARPPSPPTPCSPPASPAGWRSSCTSGPRQGGPNPPPSSLHGLSGE